MNGLGFNIKAMAGIIVLEIYGEMYWWEEYSHYLRWQIAEFGDDAPMFIRCNSIGGHPNAGLELYGIIKNHKGKTTGLIEYMCDSTATLPLCACDEVIGNEFPFEYMIHDPKWQPEWITVEQARSGADYLEKVRDDFVRIYVEKTGQKESDIRAWMKAEKFMNAEEALALGFIDKIEKVDATLEAKVDYKLAAKAYDRPKEFNIEGRGTSPTTPTNKNNTDMSTEQKNWLQAKLAAMFGKGDNTEEQDLFLDAKELKAQADKVPDLETENQTLKEENDRLKAENEELKGEEPTPEELEAEQEAAVDAELEAAVKGFKIAASAKEQYATTYKGNPEGLKAALSLIAENTVKPGVTPRPKSKGSAVSARLGVSENVSKHFGK